MEFALTEMCWDFPYITCFPVIVNTHLYRVPYLKPRGDNLYPFV